MMSPKELDEGILDAPEGTAAEHSKAGDEKEPLNLTMSVDSPSACERHVTVTIDRKDIDRYFDEAFTEMMPSAAVPGFRPGRAPRKLVEARFRKDVAEQVKSSLLMDSLSQISDEQKFTAISEPDFDLDAVELPDDGPMTFEFHLEVRPEFDLPEWKGLQVERPVREFDDEDIDRRIHKLIASHGTLVPHDGQAQVGDYVTAHLRSTHNGKQVASAEEMVIRIAAVLSLRDGQVEGFDTLMSGVRAGDRRDVDVQLSADAPNKDLRVKKVTVQFNVLDVKRLETPRLTPEFLHEMGDFQSEDELREAVTKDLQRQLMYHQSQQIRRQITAALTASADWELPPGLLSRQSERELERMMLEMKRNGFSDDEIRARENELRQNSAASTARSLKEHFILERIAEEMDIDASSGDYDVEVQLIAMQSGESTRRIRAQIEKRGLMDVLRNQIVERKVIELVRSHAAFKDTPFEPDKRDIEAIEFAAGGDDTDAQIPVISKEGEPAEAAD